MKRRRIFKFTLVVSLFLLAILITPTDARQNASSHSGKLLQDFKRLNVLGSVLYVAAHPDDENTAVLAYLAQDRLVRTAYLALTRGDGGQNLLGDEKGDLLGVLRTQELLSARRIDGARQFFTRAIDFGYSKSPQETLNKWNREQVLSDMVRVIRQFRPDIILTRFSPTQGGHGHHLASAILVLEAAKAAADPERFSEILEDLPPWQVQSVFWNAWRSQGEAVTMDVGQYNPLLGQSYTELASLSRSMHKSQGFGNTPRPGSRIEKFELLTGQQAKNDILENIDLSWNRVADGAPVAKLVDEAIRQFNPEQPERSIPQLLKIFESIHQLQDPFWKEIKQRDIRNLIARCAGLWMESTVYQPYASPGSDVTVKSFIVNRSNVPIELLNVTTTYETQPVQQKERLLKNQTVNHEAPLSLPADIPFSQPYWLISPHGNNMFTVPETGYIGLPENPPVLQTRFKLNFSGKEIEYTVPVKHRWNEAVNGASQAPFAVFPEISLSIECPDYLFTDNRPRPITVTIEALQDGQQGVLSVSLPAGWRGEPAGLPFNLKTKGDRQHFIFSVQAEKNADSGIIMLSARIGEQEYHHQLVRIDYPHIEPQTLLRDATARIIRLNLRTIPRRIGYIMGSGDDIPQVLEQLGYRIDLLSDAEIESASLTDYDVIICGVRAFNVRGKLAVLQKRLIDYVAEGGVWIVQHNTRFGKRVPQIGPYPFKVTGRDRIAQEDAPLTMLQPDHVLLQYPNQITQVDFNGWVQERGLYFAEEWDAHFTPLLSGHDSGEGAKEGGLLYASYGKGIFIYTGYSWFRQLPAGVPGAIRLFVNMISAGAGDEKF